MRGALANHRVYEIGFYKDAEKEELTLWAGVRWRGAFSGRLGDGMGCEREEGGDGKEKGGG